MGVLVGIVGKPSSGKTTFLNALCNTNAKTADYPFTTIQPNQGVGFATIPCVCQELGLTCNPRNSECIDNVRKIPIKIIDVAGLVPEAYKGRGMGNQFLSDLAQADILIHVVDISGSLNEEGEVVDPGSHDPMKDVIFLENEIAH
ncbi:MAG: GTPase, partial [Candidatus Hodarchaeota archaeon]